MQNIQRLPWECQSDNDDNRYPEIDGISLDARVSENPTVEEAVASANFESCWLNMKQSDQKAPRRIVGYRDCLGVQQIYLEKNVQVVRH